MKTETQKSVLPVLQLPSYKTFFKNEKSDEEILVYYFYKIKYYHYFNMVLKNIINPIFWGVIMGFINCGVFIILGLKPFAMKTISDGVPVFLLIYSGITIILNLILIPGKKYYLYSKEDKNSLFVEDVPMKWIQTCGIDLKNTELLRIFEGSYTPVFGHNLKFIENQLTNKTLFPINLFLIFNDKISKNSIRVMDNKTLLNIIKKVWLENNFWVRLLRSYKSIKNRFKNSEYKQWQLFYEQIYDQLEIYKECKNLYQTPIHVTVKKIKML